MTTDAQSRRGIVEVCTPVRWGHSPREREPRLIIDVEMAPRSFRWSGREPLLFTALKMCADFFDRSNGEKLSIASMWLLKLIGSSDLPHALVV